MEKLARIVIMEARAKPRLTKIEGLWRNGCKGTRGGEKKPGSMTQFIRESGLLTEATIDRLIRDVPKELTLRNEEHARGLVVESWAEFMVRVLTGLDGSPERPAFAIAVKSAADHQEPSRRAC